MRVRGSITESRESELEDIKRFNTLSERFGRTSKWQAVDELERHRVRRRQAKNKAPARMGK